MNLNFNFTQIASTFMVLFAIIDILGSMPIILKMRERGEIIHPLRTSGIALIILVTFLFAGDWILKLFHVDIESFAVAGAIVLFIYATEMLLDVELFKNKGPEGASSIIPLAFPLVAGPGSFTTLLSLRAEYAVENILVGLILNLIWVFIVLKSTAKIERVIGAGGVYVIRKFFGIILLAVSVKLFTTNLSHLL